MSLSLAPEIRIDLPKLLEHGLRDLDLHLGKDDCDKLLHFLNLIAKWNRVHNLTAVRDEQKSVSVHLLDCLAIATHCVGRRIIDVGSGAGLPGIPLAIARPELELVLLDSSQKKAAFLRQAVDELQLKNVSVVCERAETWRPMQKFDWIVCRALGELAEYVDLTKHLLAPGGTFAAMKGAYPHQEIAQLPGEYHVKRALPLTIPGLSARRHLILIECR